MWLGIKTTWSKAMGDVGTLLSVSIALVFGLALCRPDPTETQLCISECFDTVQNASTVLMCQPASLSACQETARNGSSVSYNEKPTTLSNLSVSSNRRGSFAFNFHWNISKYASFNESYNIMIEEYGKVLVESRRAIATRCNSVRISGQSSSQHFFSGHSCNYTVLPGTNYSISLTSLSEDDISLKYFFKTPENLTNMLDPPALEEWDSVVGFAVEVVNLTTYGYIVFQPAPSSFNITSYSVSITDSYKRFSRTEIINVNASMPPVYSGLVQVENYDEAQYFYAEIKPVEMEGQVCQKCRDIRSLRVFVPIAASKSSTPESTRATITPAVGVRSTASNTPPEASTTTDPIVIVKPTEDSKQSKNVTIVVAVVCGVAVAAIFIGVVYCIVKRKQCCTSGSFAMQRFRDNESNNSIAMDGAFKNRPTILIIYSYDCEAHERVVVEFATYLKHVFGCEVSLDIWEQADIQCRGAYLWMKEKLQWSQYVIVVCSTGARFKCVRRKPFRVKEEQPVPDIFQDAVDLVAENLRYSRENGEMTSKFIVSYFEYSRDSDIPPKLDTLDFYFLMSDILKLYCHIFGVSAEDTQPHSGLSVDTYCNTETGGQLYEAIERANQFFKNNPDWLGNALEPLPSFQPGSVPSALQKQGNQIESEQVSDSHENSPVRSVSSQQEVQFKVNGHSRVSSTSVSLASEEDALIDERRKKRQDTFGSLDKWKKKYSRHRKDSLDSLSNIDPSPSPHKLSKNCVAPNLSKQESPLYLNGIEPAEHFTNSEQKGSIPIKMGQSALNRDPFSPQKDMQEDGESVIYDDLQLKQDIDYIQNYDLHHQPVNPTPLKDMLLAIPTSDNDISSLLPNGSLGFSNKLYDVSNGIGMPMGSPEPCTQGDTAPPCGERNDCSDLKNNNIQDSKILTPNKPPQNDPWQPVGTSPQTTNV